MARIRTIKPTFFRHEGLQDLELAHPGAHVMLVFAALWGHCDKHGVFLWKPRQLKLDILPFLDFNMADTLDVLQSAGHLVRFDVDGRVYGHIPTFTKHQRINGKESKDDSPHPLPLPVKQPGSTGEAHGKRQGQQEGKGTEYRNGEQEEERNGARVLIPNATLDQPNLAQMLRDFTAVYPAKGRTAGRLTEDAWVDVFCGRYGGRPAADVYAELVEAVENHAASAQWATKGMIPRLEKWLRDGLYLQRHEAATAADDPALAREPQWIRDAVAAQKAAR